MEPIEPVGPVPDPTVTVVRPNPAFEKWVSRYAAIVCAASHGHTTAADWALIDPCGQHRWEARQIAYARLEEVQLIDGVEPVYEHNPLPPVECPGCTGDPADHPARIDGSIAPE